MKLSILGSGSGGNSALIAGPGGVLLIDVGLSARQLRDRLERVGVGVDRVSGVLLTHEHGDHTRGLDVLLRGPMAGVPVYANPHTAEIVRRGCKEPKRWRLVETGSFFEAAGLKIETFSVPHDAVDPMGFVLENTSSRARLGVVSDLGHATPKVLSRLRELDALFIESNYCPTLLANDTKRPWGTKQRISSRHGHLSNDQCAALVAEVACPRLRRVWLGHLSGDCNHPDTASGTLRRALGEKGLSPGPEISCASQTEPTAFYTIHAPPVTVVQTLRAPEAPAPVTRRRPGLVASAQMHLDLAF